MVVFTCGHCGESVQKPKVEKHYLTKCKNRNPNLSCMDCFKDFLGKDYETHNKCITEEERYSGKGFVPKEKKGEKKQNAWVEILQSVLDEQKNAPGNVLRIIETISKHNNTPRKKPKFINFVKNVCGIKTNPKDIDQAWDLISVKLSSLSNNLNKTVNEEGDTSAQNGYSNGIVHNGNNIGSTEENPNEQIEDIKPELAIADKKLSKKERKEEKKRKKYEAELQSAAVPPTEEVEEENQIHKKDKKKKNKSESVNEGKGQELVDDENKIKKRKRQDTANGATDNKENAVDEVIKENSNIKSEKKKLKVEGEDDFDENTCLHDQNVAKNEEAEIKTGKFDWHAVILSVLQKKGNELPFKRLQKKVLSEYSECTGREVDDRIADKFIKKLKSASNVRVDKNRVYIEE